MSHQAADRLGKWLAIGGTLLAVVAVVLGLRLMGSPADQRQVRIDERRVGELEDLQRAIREYAKTNGALPSDIGKIGDRPGSTLSIGDPETGVSYEYQRIDADTFKLCADFTTDTARQPSEVWPASSEEWTHGTGRHCFTRKRKAD
jgi:hypothetical protein